MRRKSIFSRLTKAFAKKYNRAYSKTPCLPSREIRDHHMHLIQEEFLELCDANRENNLAHIAKESGDVLYTVFAYMAALGLPAEEIFDEIHKSNMTKDQDNSGDYVKITKGEAYRPANMERVLDEATL